ncbi:MAG: CAP domain-containing protein, partial [Lachnospiraceae bacterium]|nr:CAP domain-containing protein [Lachnospiraceae bacterium]
MAAYEPATVSGNETDMLTDEIKEVLAQVNGARVESGLPELVWNGELAEAADIRAKEIEQIFSHVRPDGSEWWTVNDEVIYGENIARGYQNAESVMEAWMKSSEHKDNI